MADTMAAGSAAGTQGRERLFASLRSEQADLALPVTGALPAWLSGMLLRNGPAEFDLPGRPVRHWFDGAAMLHGFTIADGTVRYSNRFLQTRARALALEAGKPMLRGFATDPCSTLFSRMKAVFRPNATDNANINVARFGDDFVALAESALPVRFDPRTLRTLGVRPIGKRDSMAMRYTTAHPVPAGGKWVLTHLTHFGRRSTYEVLEFDPATGSERTLATMKVAEPAYMHSFAASPRHVLLTEFPLVVNPLKLVLGTRTFIESHRWKPGRGTKFIVVDRVDGTIRHCTAEAMFAFHHVNAFDDGDDLVVDLVGYDDPSIIDTLYLATLRGDGALPFSASTVRRYRLRPRTGSATLERSGARGLELPQIDQRTLGQAQDVVYGVSLPDPDARPFAHAIARYDGASGQTTMWSHPDCFAGEPVFAPRPGGEANDGVILSVVLDAQRRRSFLLVLDARSLRELARAEAPHAVPAGLHGAFFGDAA